MKTVTHFFQIAFLHGRELLMKVLIQKNKERKDHLLTTIPNAAGKIPVQLACGRGNEDMTKFLYIETPSYFLHPKNGDYGFYLLKDCISKKMFGIALHLLYQIPDLAFHRCRSDSTSNLVTLSQFSESPFSPNNQLAFWNWWLYHCINFEVKFKPADDRQSGGQLNDQEREKIGFDVHARILGIRWDNCSILKEIKEECDVEANQQEDQGDHRILVDQAIQQEDEDDELSNKKKQENELDEEATLGVVDQADHQERDIFISFRIIKKRNVLKRAFRILWLLPLALILILFGLGADICSKLYFFVTDYPVYYVRSFLGKLSSLIGLKKTYDLKLNHEYVKKILNLLSEQLKRLDADDLVKNGATEAAFLAIRNNIPEIVMEFTKANENILGPYSNLDDLEKNMLAMAVINRQEKVAKYLYELDIKNAIGTSDKDGNNMLHLAAKLAPRAQLAHISGAALKLQSELRWFKGVEGIVPLFQKDSKNKKDEIPFELFATEHENLMKEAEEWLKKASESSTVVGALIITIMFTAAFTVPGGNNQETGLPIFSHKLPFYIFIIADAVSLFAAATSVLMFLGILTSRYALEDFIKSLPLKLILGLSSLFVSIAAMMAAFCAALFIILHGRLEVIVPITLLAVIPVTSFVLLQFPLLVEILKSTYSSDIFEKKKDSELLKLFHLICYDWEWSEDIWEDIVEKLKEA